jgi:hypothetical protein
MHELRPFLTYRMCECVERMVSCEGVENGVGAIASGIGLRVGLKPEQHEVFALAATGMSVGAIIRRYADPEE